MQVDGGDWVIRDGARVREPSLDRGAIQICSEKEMRDQLDSGATSWAIITAAVTFLALIILFTDWSHPIRTMGIVSLACVPFIVVRWFLTNRALSGRTAMPGVYEHGVELLERTFVPYEEVERTSRRNGVVWRQLVLHIKGSGMEFRLSEDLYGNGIWHVEAKIRDPTEKPRPPRRLKGRRGTKS